MKTLKLFALALAVAGIVGSEADAGGRRSRRCSGGSCATTVSTCSGGSCQVATTAPAPTQAAPATPAKEAPKAAVTTSTATEGTCSTGTCSSCGSSRGRRGR